MLGWKLEKGGEYRIKLPILSKEEQEFIVHIEKEFRDLARIKEFEDIEEIRKAIESIIEEKEEEGYVLEREQKNYLIDLSLKHIYGLSAFEDLLKDENIEEISVIGINKPVYVYIRKEGWKETNLYITTLEYLIDLINKMASPIGRRITLKNPRIDAILKDGSRLHASIPPISEGELTIRKFKAIPLSPKDILESKSINEEIMAILSLFMQSDTTILVCGNTSSGKTTLLNSLFNFVPKRERILITEETPEIRLMHKHVVRLIANKEMEISLKDLVYDSLRMRPDRVIVGEIRNEEETQAFADVMLAGQARGAYATFHAKSGREAINRLISFGINPYDVNSIDLILVQRRMGLYKDKRIIEVRRLTEVCFVENQKPKQIVSFDFSKDKWSLNKKEAIEKLALKLAKEKKEIEKEIKNRVKFLKEFEGDYKRFFEEWQSKWLKEN